MNKNYSLQALNDFLDYAAEKGLLKRNTAVSRKLASSKILSVLEPDEASDLRQVDIDHAFERFANLQGTSFKPESLRVYQSRLRSSLTDFFAWVDNPSRFKPAGSQRNPANGQRQPKKAGHADSAGGGGELRASSPNTPQAREVESISIPVPLRDGLTVRILNIPADLTSSEAEKLAAIVKAYAQPGK